MRDEKKERASFMPGVYSDQIANSLKGAPVCERWTLTGPSLTWC